MGTATILISLASLFSYIIGFLRDRILSTNFGTSAKVDAYQAAFLIPDFIFQLFIAGALSAAFMPVFSQYLHKDKKEAFKLANTMLTTATLLITALAIIAFIFAHKIIPIALPKAEPELYKDIIAMTRIVLASSILFAISNTLGNILMSYKHFFAYALSPTLYNLGIIIGILTLKDTYGIYSAAIGAVIGAAFHCTIRVIDTINTSYKFKPELDIKHPGFKKILKLMIPKSISLIAWQINLLIYGAVSLGMSQGTFSAFNYARNIQSFSVSLFGIAFATAVFPFLSSSINEGKHKEYTEKIQQTIQRILFFTIPAAIGLMFLSNPVISLILKGGEFDDNSVKITSSILFFFALAIPFESLSQILARSFYALKNTLTPMLINITSMTIIALITIFVTPKLGAQWLSIGFTIGFVFYIIASTILLRKHLKGFKTKQFFSSISKVAIASIIMTATLYATKNIDNTIPSKIAVLLRIAIGASSFLITAYIIKSPEIESVKFLLDKIGLKKKKL